MAKNKKRPAPTADPEKLPISEKKNPHLEWDLRERPETWATAAVISWQSTCRRYRVSRVEAFDGSPVYFGACYRYVPNSDNALPCWDTIESAKEGPGYPKKYSNLEQAVDAAEEHLRKNVGDQMTSNRNAILEYAVEKNLSARPQRGVSERKPRTYHETNHLPVSNRGDAMNVTFDDAKRLLGVLGFKADKWNEKKIQARISSPDVIAAAEKNEPEGEDLKLFRIVSKAIENGETIHLTKIPEDDPDTAPEATGKPAKASKKAKADKPAGDSKPSRNGKMSGLDAAVKVLSEVKNPLSAKEIIDRAEQKGYWVTTNGKTPWNTLSAGMNTEIHKKGNASRFIKPEPGKFTLANKVGGKK